MNHDDFFYKNKYSKKIRVNILSYRRENIQEAVKRRNKQNYGKYSEEVDETKLL